MDVNDVKTVLRLGGALSAASREVFKSLEDGLVSFHSFNEDCIYASMVRIMAPQLENMLLDQQLCPEIN